jgi:hypothetical protein
MPPSYTSRLLCQVYNCLRPAPIIADAGSPTDDWAEQHVRMLRELAELGMELARAMARQALAEADGAQPVEQADGRPRCDPGLAFSRIARAVRLTLALEARTREGAAAARRTPDAAEAAARRVRARLHALLATPRGPRAAEVHRVVEQAFEASIPTPTISTT